MKKIILINAIIWASMILIASWLFKGDENYFYMFGALLVGFTLINSMLGVEEGKKKKRNCLK